KLRPTIVRGQDMRRRRLPTKAGDNSVEKLSIDTAGAGPVGPPLKSCISWPSVCTHTLFCQTTRAGLPTKPGDKSVEKLSTEARHPRGDGGVARIVQLFTRPRSALQNGHHALPTGGADGDQP